MGRYYNRHPNQKLSCAKPIDNRIYTETLTTNGNQRYKHEADDILQPLG